MPKLTEEICPSCNNYYPLDGGPCLVCALREDRLPESVQRELERLRAYRARVDWLQESMDSESARAGESAALERVYELEDELEATRAGESATLEDVVNLDNRWAKLRKWLTEAAESRSSRSEVHQRDGFSLAELGASSRRALLQLILRIMEDLEDDK